MVTQNIDISIPRYAGVARQQGRKGLPELIILGYILLYHGLNGLLETIALCTYKFPDEYQFRYAGVCRQLLLLLFLKALLKII